MRSKEEALAIKPNQEWRIANKTRTVRLVGVDAAGVERVLYKQVTVKMISVKASAFRRWAANAEYLGGAE